MTALSKFDGSTAPPTSPAQQQPPPAHQPSAHPPPAAQARETAPPVVPPQPAAAPVTPVAEPRAKETPPTILAFLQYLEKKRLNTARTRNARLAAIRAFVRFCLGYLQPDFASNAQRILAIPCKRSVRPVLGFMNLNEVESLLGAIDVSTRTGRRDYLLFSLLYNTGARVSEALQLTPAAIQHRVVRLHGKGRKERDVPLWPETHRQIQKWCRENKIGSDQPIFGNPAGKPLSRRTVARRFAQILRTAQKCCPALHRRDLSPHSIRHYVPFRTMSSNR
jgi:integrase/recombinase XerD